MNASTYSTTNIGRTPVMYRKEPATAVISIHTQFVEVQTLSQASYNKTLCGVVADNGGQKCSPPFCSVSGICCCRTFVPRYSLCLHQLLFFFWTLCDLMIRLGNSNLESAKGFESLPWKNSRFKAQEKSTLKEFIIKLCAACSVVAMASIPPSVFTAGRIRETQREMKISTERTSKGPKQFYNNSNMEPSPMKYNSKLMNSIWGFYNRYSPHNVKKINNDSLVNEELQQVAANSSTNNEPRIKLEKIWAAITLSQSH